VKSRQGQHRGIAESENGPEPTTLNFGSLPVIYERLDYLRSVIVGVWVIVGSRFERPREQGFSHFVEHMLFKGTSSRDRKEVVASLERLGGELNAFTGREYSCYFARAASRHFGHTMDVLSDIVLNSTFPEDEFERERGVVLEEIRMYEDSPEELSHELLQSNMFGPPLGHPIVGSEKIISKCTREKVFDYYRRMYGSGRIFLTILGNVSREEVEEQVAHFAPLINARSLKRPKMRPSESFCRRILARKPIEQLHMCFGVKAISMSHKDRYVLHLINTYLGGGMSSRLFQEIREKRGLAYNVYSFAQSFHDMGMWGFYCATSPDKGPQVRKILEKELDRLKKRGIGARKVRQLKDQMIGSLMLGLEKTSFRMTRVAFGHIYFDGIVPIDQVLALVESVTPEDVKRVVNELLKNGFQTAVAVGPVPEGAEEDVLGGPVSCVSRK